MQEEWIQLITEFASLMIPITRHINISRSSCCLKLIGKDYRIQRIDYPRYAITRFSNKLYPFFLHFGILFGPFIITSCLSALLLFCYTVTNRHNLVAQFSIFVCTYADVRMDVNLLVQFVVFQ